MNETVKSVLERQTVREYKPEQITDGELELLTLAAKRAPSGRNTQPCYVRFVQNRGLLDEMNRDFKELVGYDTPAYTNWDIHPFYHNAPTTAFIFSPGRSETDGGIMVENICVAAWGMGIGTCIIGSIGALFEDSSNGKKWRNKLNIPENFCFLIAAAIGYPALLPEMKPRFDDRIEIIR